VNINIFKVLDNYHKVQALYTLTIFKYGDEQ
jgi:hypothetical protein